MRAELPGGSGTTPPILAHLGGPSTFALLPASQVSSCELLCRPDFGHSTLLLICSAAGTIPPRLRWRRVRHLPPGKLDEDCEWDTLGGPF